MPVSKIFDIDDGWPSRNCNPAAPGFWQNRSAATYCPPADLSLPLGPSVGENGALFFTPGLPTSNPRRRIAMPSRRERANAIRALSMDAVQKANSGHPGAPMGMADIAEVLWRDYMQHNPSNPQWANRDRFVLSNGHGSMLIYSLLHLTGYDLGIEDLKNFRQLNSRTPGHPEYGYTAGVETTTGPLGQGIANAVGMALAEKVLA
ncbi:hypothetical protein L6P87_30675, partial [Klebsiella pneumoniae]|nr:hypothetical protein [Klebsiella pneumoniae]